jgi:hypothetical protein
MACNSRAWLPNNSLKSFNYGMTLRAIKWLRARSGGIEPRRFGLADEDFEALDISLAAVTG